MRHKTEHLADVLRELRTSRGLSQPRLAAAAGVSGGYIGMLEVGARGNRPSRDKLLALAQGLNLDDEEWARLCRAGGLPPEPLSEEAGDELRRAIMRDRTMTSDQKKALLAVYKQMVGKALHVKRPARPRAGHTSAGSSRPSPERRTA